MVRGVLSSNALVHHVKPIYPKEARQKGIRGSVVFRARITRTGEIGDLQVIRGHPLLVPAALRAVRQWRCTPCILGGEPVEVITDIEVTFYP